MIKFIAKAKDIVTGKKYNIGDEVDLGEERNKNAVEINKIAVWVDSREFQKEVIKIEKEKAEKKPVIKGKKNIETK